MADVMVLARGGLSGVGDVIASTPSNLFRGLSQEGNVVGARAEGGLEINAAGRAQFRRRRGAANSITGIG